MKLVASFGFRYKKPSRRDFDLIVDATSLRNPFNANQLRDLNGLDPRVQTFVLDDPKAQQLIQSIIDLEPESVAIGCFGGRHRSVAIAEEIGRRTGATIVHINKKDWPK